MKPDEKVFILNHINLNAMNEEVLSEEETTATSAHEVSILETSVAIIVVLLFLWVLGGGSGRR